MYKNKILNRNRVRFNVVTFVTDIVFNTKNPVHWQSFGNSNEKANSTELPKKAEIEIPNTVFDKFVKNITLSDNEYPYNMDFSTFLDSVDEETRKEIYYAIESYVYDYLTKKHGYEVYKCFVCIKDDAYETEDVYIPSKDEIDY